ncbi:hypothetical protein VN97_g11910 [Penicillium thymicola]|uniref:Uncharacterized protein n=1 Tax=Penicillium thymicola TaxID=293382 RepID=A0AAI9T6X9_PENTH|nr:hypothetical protein VN97_g11910 [Penicillium thymicola]
MFVGQEFVLVCGNPTPAWGLGCLARTGYPGFCQRANQGPTRDNPGVYIQVFFFFFFRHHLSSVSFTDTCLSEADKQEQVTMDNNPTNPTRNTLVLLYHHYCFYSHGWCLVGLQQIHS